MTYFGPPPYPSEIVAQFEAIARAGALTPSFWIVGECDSCGEWISVAACRVGPRKGQPLKPFTRCPMCKGRVTQRAPVTHPDVPSPRRPTKGAP